MNNKSGEASPLTLPESERNRLAAEKVLGWDAEYCEDFIASNNASADYLILRKVRETWSVDDRISFGAALDAEIWAVRERIDSMGMLDYEPGDYRDAALLVLAEKGEI